jgi:hypothetical protein
VVSIITAVSTVISPNSVAAGVPQDVSVVDLVTYLKNFDIHLLDALDDKLELEDVEIKACVRRLNQRTLNFTVTENSDH